VTAPADAMAVIEELIPKLDAPDVNVQITKIVELQNADPAEVAQALNAALAGQSAAPPQRGRWGRVMTPANTTAMKGRNVLVVAARSARAVLLTGETEDVAFAEKLIKQIDQRPNIEKATVKTFPVKHAKVEDLARVLIETIGQTRRGRPGASSVPTRISADKNANALVVSAAADVLERIEELLVQLDVAEANKEAITIEIVTLKNAKADQLAQALNSAQTGQAGRRGPRGAPDETDLVRVTADVASNSLLLTGRPARIEETKLLITQLDAGSAELTSTMQIFRLKQAKASELVPVLQQILVPKAQQRSFSPWQRRGGGGATQQPDIRIAAQDKANAIVVHDTNAYLIPALCWTAVNLDWEWK
ncbi:hypothetical protein LCGC14_3014880, partial [marine sediment metagenome]